MRCSCAELRQFVAQPIVYTAGMKTDAWPVAAIFLLIAVFPVLSQFTGTPMRWGSRRSGETWPMSLAGVLSFSAMMFCWAIGAMILDKTTRLIVMGIGLGFFISAVCLAVRDVRRSKREGTSEKHHPSGPLG